MDAGDDDGDDLLEQVADALLALSGIELGDFTTRISTATPDPRLAKLYAGINDMIIELQEQDRRNRAYQEERQKKLDTIERQREAIRELSTPVLDVWDGILCVPIVGTIDTARGVEMTQELLRSVVARRARYAIVDITGIEVMDTATIHSFIQMARCTRMLGAECALTGINPAIAQTMVTLALDLSGLVTFRTLREALRHFTALEERRVAQRHQLRPA